jgi:hypothetical protein
MTKSADLSQLVYVSSNCISAESLDQEIDVILNTARQHNKNNNITGALLFNTGHFAQVLEGPEAAVENIFERIQGDERHENCIVLSCESIQNRSFSEWSMAYEGGDSVAKNQFSHMLENSDKTGDILAADEVFRILVEHINPSK